MCLLAARTNRNLAIADSLGEAVVSRRRWDKACLGVHALARTYLARSWVHLGRSGIRKDSHVRFLFAEGPDSMVECRLGLVGGMSSLTSCYQPAFRWKSLASFHRTNGTTRLPNLLFSIRSRAGVGRY